ncbi:delta-aminolevulinic acid dehydratase [Staphylococcus succinus]|nr:delta-aminolevulinic acid dehydratase [Staphylococcus succinus]
MEEIKSASVSRRFTEESEFNLTPDKFAQPIDLDISLEGDIEKAMFNMPDYPFRSLENSKNFIKEVKKSGINTIVLRITGEQENRSDIYDKLEDQSAAFQSLRNSFDKSEITFVVDPFSVALNKDGSWGIKDYKNDLDNLKTSQLLSDIALAYGTIGTDYILTLGRAGKEVEITKKTLDFINSDTQIMSFSQNTETQNAYMYLKDKTNHTDTGQKILVGNITDMTLRTIFDIHEGSNVVVVKPVENFHLILATSQFLESKDKVISFLTSDSVNKIAQYNPEIEEKIKDILFNINEFNEKSKNVKIASYTVSGTYYLQKSFEEEKGEQFASNVVEELLKNALSAANDKFFKLIDRNAYWYFNH